MQTALDGESGYRLGGTPNAQDAHPECTQQPDDPAADRAQAQHQRGLVAQTVERQFVPLVSPLLRVQLAEPLRRPQQHTDREFRHFGRVGSRTVGDEPALGMHGVVEAAVRSGVFGMGPAWPRQRHRGVHEFLAVGIAGQDDQVATVRRCGPRPVGLDQHPPRAWRDLLRGFGVPREEFPSRRDFHPPLHSFAEVVRNSKGPVFREDQPSAYDLAQARRRHAA